MISKIRNILTIMAVSAALLAPVFTVGIANAQIQEQLCQGAAIDQPGSGGGCNNVDDAGSSVQKVASDVINLLSWVVGVISVIMIIVGGFRYITSGGASDKVTGAKNTIIYAIIGLIIVALAQFIVNFVLAKTIDASNN